MGDTVKIKMLRQLAVSVLLFSSVLAQDTHYCNDGWELYTTEWHGQEHHSCFWFGQNNEKVTHDVAKLICEGMGGFMAEIPYGPHLNYWIVGKLLEKNKFITKVDSEVGAGAPNYDIQYWLGATDLSYHNIHHPGNWVWEHRNTTVQWFDWADGEPNNFHHGENCLTMLYYEDWFGFRNFHWNDEKCDHVMDFICEQIID